MDDTAASDIGGRIRRARRERGLSLHDAARATKLSHSILRAIERNDFQSLPGGCYRRAYVRTLASEVGLDPNEIAADYIHQFEPPIEPAGAVESPAEPRRWAWPPTSVPRSVVVAVVTLVSCVALAAVAAWLARPDEPSTVVAHTSRTADVPGIVPTRSPVDAPLRIEIEAIDWCWIAAESDGQRVIYRLVKPGEQLVVDAERTIVLRLGDGGAVTLAINGGLPQSFGRRGEVLEFTLTPETVERLRDAAVSSASES